MGDRKATGERRTWKRPLAGRYTAATALDVNEVRDYSWRDPGFAAMKRDHSGCQSDDDMRCARNHQCWPTLSPGCQNTVPLSRCSHRQSMKSGSSCYQSWTLPLASFTVTVYCHDKASFTVHCHDKASSTVHCHDRTNLTAHDIAYVTAHEQSQSHCLRQSQSHCPQHSQSTTKPVSLPTT